MVQKAAADADVEVETVLMDVSDVEACKRVMSALRLYGLVNSAGYSGMGAVEDVSDDEARLELETMVVAPMRLARLALPYMRSQREGRSVNVSSIDGLTTTRLTRWYQAAKHALEALSDALRVEVASSGVKVSLVEPGGFRTGIWEETQHVLDERAGSRYAASYRRSMEGTRLTEPLMGHPRQVASVIVQALTARHPRARYLVGIDAQAMAVVDRFTPTVIRTG